MALNNLDHNSRQMPISASTNALCLTMPLGNMSISFEELHKQCKQSTQTQVAHFKLSFELYKLFNSEEGTMNHTRLANQMVGGRQQNLFMSFCQNKY